MRTARPGLLASLLIFVPAAAFAQGAGDRFLTYDEVRVSCTYYPPPEDAKEKRPCVILVHMLKRTQDDWKDIALDLQKEGFAVLTFDLRGHGKSNSKKGAEIIWSDFSEQDYKDMVLDVKAAIRYLEKKTDVDGQRIVVVGASIGANVALQYAASEKSGEEVVKGVALLSPGENYRGVTTLDAIEKYGSRRLFLAASEDDRQSYDATKKLGDKSKDEKKVVKLFSKAGHGTNMFAKEADLAKDLKEWIKEAAK